MVLEKHKQPGLRTRRAVGTIGGAVVGGAAGAMTLNPLAAAEGAVQGGMAGYALAETPEMAAAAKVYGKRYIDTAKETFDKWHSGMTLREAGRLAYHHNVTVPGLHDEQENIDTLNEYEAGWWESYQEDHNIHNPHNPTDDMEVLDPQFKTPEKRNWYDIFAVDTNISPENPRKKRRKADHEDIEDIMNPNYRERDPDPFMPSGAPFPPTWASHVGTTGRYQRYRYTPYYGAELAHPVRKKKRFQPHKDFKPKKYKSKKYKSKKYNRSSYKNKRKALDFKPFWSKKLKMYLSKTPDAVKYPPGSYGVTRYDGKVMTVKWIR